MTKAVHKQTKYICRIELTSSLHELLARRLRMFDQLGRHASNDAIIWPGSSHNGACCNCDALTESARCNQCCAATDPALRIERSRQLAIAPSNMTNGLASSPICALQAKRLSDAFAAGSISDTQTYHNGKRLNDALSSSTHVDGMGRCQDGHVGRHEHAGTKGHLRFVCVWRYQSLSHALPQVSSRTQDGKPHIDVDAPSKPDIVAIIHAEWRFD